MAHYEHVAGLSRAVYCATRQEWRDWLERNYDESKEIWLIYYKKSSDMPRVPYDDAVEEAICFGWIDTTVRTIDEARYVQRYTPRNSRSEWSEANVARAKKMISAGLMTEVGMEKFRNRRMTRRLHEVDGSGELIVPVDLAEALEENGPAQANFTRLARSHRKQYVRWINDAKRQETRERRIREAVAMLAEDKKLGMR